MLKKWTALLLGLLIVPIGIAKTLENNEFTTWLEKNMREQHIPGVSIALIKDFSLSEAKAFGKLQSGLPNALTTESRFQAGELTQAITATFALKTSYDGLLSLNAPLNRFLTSWRIPDNEFSRRRAITATRVLNGSSGTNVTDAAYLATNANTPTLLQLLNGEKPASNKQIAIIETPGITYKPTQGSYLILQQALEDIYQKPFATLIEDKIFTPLAMKNSSFSFSEGDAKTQQYAQPHNTAGIAINGGPQRSPAQAAKGLWTTPSDMANWMIANLKAFNGNQEQLLHPKIAHKLFNANLKNRNPDIPDTSLGLIANVDRFGAKQDKGQYFILSGQMPGYQALLIGNKRSGDGAIIMLNKAKTTNQQVSAELMDMLMQIADHERWHDKASRA